MNMLYKSYPVVLLGIFLLTAAFLSPALEEDCACKIYIPNAFSPNEDGVNDTFQPYISCPVQTYEFRVFNRWGQLVFSSLNPEDAWNGEINGVKATTGVYAYVLRVTYDDEGKSEEEIKTGDVALVR